MTGRINPNLRNTVEGKYGRKFRARYVGNYHRKREHDLEARKNIVSWNGGEIRNYTSLEAFERNWEVRK